MKIAIDISPLKTGHKVRGTGFYVQHMKDALTEYFPEHEYVWFENISQIPKNTDVVHYPYFDPFFLTLPFAKSHPTVVTVHDLTPLVFPMHFPIGIKGAVKWRLQQLALKRADRIITDSEASKKDISNITKISHQKIDVAYLAAGEEFERFKTQDAKVKKLKEKYNLPEKFALYVGDVTWNKNVPRIVEACVSAHIPLVLVGKALAQETFDRKNPWNQDLVLAQNLIHGSKNCIPLGFVPTDDLVQLYNAATLAVLPSLYEGFGLPVLEAMQSGCPVVTSHAGSLKEVVNDAAYIVDPLNLDNMIDGFSKVFHDEVLQKKLSQKGLEQAKKFSWKKTAEETILTYQSVLKK